MDDAVIQNIWFVTLLYFLSTNSTLWVYERTLRGLYRQHALKRRDVPWAIVEVHLSVRLAFVIWWKECQCLHELVTLRDGYVTVVELFRGFAVDVEPPVTLQNRLVKQRWLWTEETFHDKSIICERTHVENLRTELKMLVVTHTFS